MVASGLKASTPKNVAVPLLITTFRGQNQPPPQWVQVTCRPQWP